MRKLVRGGSINEVEDKLKHLGGQWKPITEIKLDPSQISYNVVEYVCVVEMPDNEEQKAKAKNRKWGKF